MNPFLLSRPFGRRNHYLSGKPVSAGVAPHWWLVCLLLTGLSSDGWGQCFNRATTIPIGTDPRSVAVGDFNGDGRPDLVTANAGSNNVSVLLGDGSGGFTATDFPVGTDPQWVAVGDFNGDGRPDLVTANAGSGNVSVLLGNGSGGFGAPTNFPVGIAPNSVAVGEFNGDGWADLAVTTGSKYVSVLLGDGSGGFGAPTNFPVGYNPYAVAIGDFNGDGRADLVIGNTFYRNVSVLLGNGSGGFGAATNFFGGGDSIDIAVGDFNGDGRADLAVTNAGDGLSVLLGNGKGGFGAPGNFYFYVGDNNAYPHAVAVGDFNGDGWVDLVTANRNSNNVSVLLNCRSNRSPVLTIALLIIPQPATVTVAYSVSLAPAVTDPDGDVLTFSASGLPPGLSIDPTTGVISGTPSTTVGSPFTVTLTATDPQGASVSISGLFNVVNPATPPPANQAPVLTGTLLTIPQPATVTVAYSVSLAPAVTDPDGDVLTFSATGLPPGLSINPITGVISGTPSTTVGSPFTVTLTATDPQGSSVSLGGLFTVVNPATPPGGVTTGGGGARRSVSIEPTDRLQVNLLGNPVGEAIEVEVTGVENTLLHLSLTDIKGRIIGQRRTERAGPREQYRFDVSTLPQGILLLRTSSGGQSQTVRVLKVN